MHMECLGEEIDAHGVSGRRKSMHMNLQDEKIDAHEPSGRKKSMHPRVSGRKNQCTGLEPVH